MTLIQRLSRHPRGFWFVFWGELAERASFYGMRTLLALYLIDEFKFDQGHAGQTVQFFIAACYIMPLLGGIIADRYLGKFRTILYFSFPYILGHILLGNAHEPIWMFAALFLLAMGSGSVKPNASTLMGSIYEKEGKTALLTEAFSIFYAAVNLGSAVTSLSLPIVRNMYGYRTALMVPTIAMIIAFFVFAMGKKLYPVEVIPSTVKKSAKQKAEERATLTRIAGIFTLIVGFWMVYDQYSSTWIFLARDHMNLELWPFGIKLAADQVQGFNPIFIILFTPVFIWFWDFYERKTGKPAPATRKMITGFVLVVCCTLIMSGIGFFVGDGKVSVWFQLIATAVMALAELCISVVGLEFAYNVASKETKSTVTAAFFVTIFAGNMLGGWLDGYYDKMAPGVFFGIQAIALACCTIAFHFVGRRFENATARLVATGQDR